MAAAFICEGVRTPIGRYGGALSSVRTDDLATVPLSALRGKFPKSDWESIDEVIMGCVNQAGEDNRNVARMAALLSGIPHTVPAASVNRLCGSGMEAVSVVARAIAAGASEHGATVHFVAPEMDSGPIILQGKVAVTPDDTEATLAARVLAVEHRIYPEALRLVAEGHATLAGA